MSAQNVELVHRLFGELAAGFPVDQVDSHLNDAALEQFFDPDVEWIPVAQSLLATDSYRGYEGVRRFWREFLSTWDDYAIEAEEFLDAGDQVAVRMRLTGRTHDVEVDELWSSLSTIRDGRVVRVQGFTTPDGALEAAGLRG
jgi:ketosteroid isomerase-like protein